MEVSSCTLCVLTERSASSAMTTDGGDSGVRGKAILGDVLFNKNLGVNLVDDVLSVAKQSKGGHDDGEELGVEEVIQV